MDIVVIDLPHLGNRCHLVHDGRHALVVDPPRDPRPVERAAARAGVEITVVADTHVHQDHLSGALILARRHGADHLLSADETVSFERVGVRHGDVVRVGRLEVEVLAAPGHTRHHQAFLVRSPEPGIAPALLSGGSLLAGTVGRPDLVDPALTRDLAGRQWTTVRALAELDPATRLLPTHTPRSRCAGPLLCTGVGESARDAGTLADELRAHPALLLDRETFVTELLAALPPASPHLQHLAPLNRAGAGRASLRTARLATAAQVTDAVLRGAWVIDLRGPRAHAAGHVPGSLSLGSGSGLAEHVAWLVPWEDDIVLLSDSSSLLPEAVATLADLGIDAVGTHVVDAASDARTRQPLLAARNRRADWATFVAELDLADATSAAPVLIDVRPREDWEAGHLPGAIPLALHEVESKVHELPPGVLWVHCRSGHRAGLVSSLLERHGRHVVHVDDRWESVHDLALPVVRESEVAA